MQKAFVHWTQTCCGRRVTCAQHCNAKGFFTLLFTSAFCPGKRLRGQQR